MTSNNQTLFELGLGDGAGAIRGQLDLSRRGDPISPHIYGQFIEHLGRCIYGGIWAEMLEDRKFYYPVNTDYQPYTKLEDTDFPVVGASPWQVLAGSVSMSTDAPFVGRHSPRLDAGTTIAQHDLGVIAGRACDGTLWARAEAASAVVEVTLRWGDDATQTSSQRLRFGAGAFDKQPFRLLPQATLERGARFEIRTVEGALVIGTVSLMPEDNVRGLRRDTLSLLKQLRGTIYRWPGGNFVSGYEWRDGIGDRDRRPPRKNPAWTGVEHNDFGTDEFIDFCREVGAEPMIAVNTGFGDAHSAAQWVEYCNGTVPRLAAQWRTNNGHQAPFGVHYWCVGNEMFGPWQLGFMQVRHYVIKHNQVADAMWEADPSVELVAVGAQGMINSEHDPEQAKSGKGWSEHMLEGCADKMNLLSEHFYEGRTPWSEQERLPLTEHVGLLRASIRKRAEGHRELQKRFEALAGRTVPIAMDEWNYWHRECRYGELGCAYDWQDGLGVALGLHEYFRNSDVIQMAHFAQSVNVLGAIKTTRIAAEMETSGLVLQLYREHFGMLPLSIDGDFAPCDVTAALRDDGRTLTLGVVNPSVRATTLTVDAPIARVQRWTLAAPDAAAQNQPGKKREVDVSGPVTVSSVSAWEVPALSCNVFEVTLSK